MSIGMTREEAIEWMLKHPGQKCHRCGDPVPKSKGDDGIHEALLRVCVPCMLKENEELRGERLWCEFCDS